MIPKLVIVAQFSGENNKCKERVPLGEEINQSKDENHATLDARRPSPNARLLDPWPLSARAGAPLDFHSRRRSSGSSPTPHSLANAASTRAAANPS
jgi:hypothetical protein